MGTDGRTIKTRHASRFSARISHKSIRNILWQLLLAAILLIVGVWLVFNLRHNLATRNMASGFDFLGREAGVPIAEHLIPYTPTDTYFRALLAGTINTLWVSFWGIVLATTIGTAIGIARLSKNWLLAKLSAVYIEFFRAIPLLLQLLLWYTLLQRLPPVRQAFHPLPGFILSNRGFSFPMINWTVAHIYPAAGFLIGVAAVWFISKKSTQARLDDGKRRKFWPINIALLAILPVIASLVSGARFDLVVPATSGFNVRGGSTVSPEFFALLIGIVIYNAAFVAEIIRSGLESVGIGQHEAARALGLKPRMTLNWVVFPQALRVIIPPLTGQFLNITKHAALAVVIGYQDLVSVANTAMNQSGHALELVAIIMAVYLTISLSISFLMNVYNSRVALVER